MASNSQYEGQIDGQRVVFCRGIGWLTWGRPLNPGIVPQGDVYHS